MISKMHITETLPDKKGRKSMRHSRLMRKCDRCMYVGDEEKTVLQRSVKIPVGSSNHVSPTRQEQEKERINQISQIRLNFSRIPVQMQRSPAINEPGDQYEQEADRVAESVLSESTDRISADIPAKVPFIQRQGLENTRSGDDASKEVAKKAREVLETVPQVKKILERLDREGEAFISTLNGKIITGSVAAGAISALAATNAELPVQLPEISLGKGLSVELVYKGPARNPTEASITFTYEEQVGKSSERGGETGQEDFAATAARINAELKKSQEQQKTPEQREKEKKESFDRAVWNVKVPRWEPPDMPGLEDEDPTRKQQWEDFLLKRKDPFVLRPIAPPGLKREEPILQRKESAGEAIFQTAPPIVYEALGSTGQPLDAQSRAFFEQRFGYDFSQVRVHTDSKAVESAPFLNALAYTAGRDVVFGAGQFAPESSTGRRLLAHELTHVIQQGGGVSPAADLRIGPVRGELESQANAAEGAPQLVLAGSIAGVVQRDVLPVAKFSPAPGLFLDRTDRAVSISGAMELSGTEANAARAALIQNTINTVWNHTFQDGYSVMCNIKVTYRGRGSKAGDATQIKADKISGPSHVSPGISGRSMILNADLTVEPDVFTWVAAHEFGHIISLRDRYSEGIMSRVRGNFGGERVASPEPGWAGNLMAESGGVLESKNVRSIAEESELLSTFRKVA